MTKNNTPALRFDGFNGEWVLKTVSEISAQIRRVNPASQAPVKMISAASGFINQSEKYSSDNAGQSLKKYVELYKGELAYNHGASKLRPFGSCFELKEDFARVPFVYHCFRVLNENSTFTALSLNRDAIQVQLQRLISSGARMDGLLNISFDQYGTVSAYFPSPEEQRAIGELFSGLDALIEQRRAKHANLQQIKTALLQRMFPQDGADAPELRLGGFEGVWTYTRLADIAQMYQPQTIASKELQKSGVPVFGANGFIGFYNAANHTTDQVTISARGENTGTPSYVSGPVWITGNSMVVNVDSSSIDKRFLYGILSSRSLKSLVTGGAQPQLTRNVLNEYRISIPPTLEEQRAIGEVFSNLDSLIAAEASYITQLIQAKTALLQRMFV